MNTAHRRRLNVWLGWLLQPWFAATLFIAWYLWQTPAQWQTDSMELYRGCRGLLDWLQGRAPTVGRTRQFPLFQYISGVAALWAVRRGVLINIYSVWCASSLLGLAIIVIVFQRAAKRLSRPEVGWALAVVMLSGPLLMYANSTFNELVSATCILCFTAAVMGRANVVLCAALFWISGITKETAPLMLSVIWLGAMWIRWPRANGPRANGPRFVRGLALLCSLLVTLATNAVFNVLRYGAIWNHDYLQSHDLIHSLSWRVQYCVALWISPNGGVAVFWPMMTIFTFGVIAIALRSGQSAAPAVVVGALLAGLTWGLSGWYAPFGWEAWGPRLMLPWLPASLLIVVRGYPDASARLVDRCLRNQPAFAITAAITCLCALPQVMAASEPLIVGPFFGNDLRFPHAASPLQPAQFYAWNVYLAWQKMPFLLARPVIDGFTALRGLEAICFLAALVTFLRKGQRSSVRRSVLVHM